MLCGVIQILCLRLGDQVKPVAGGLWGTLKRVKTLAECLVLTPSSLHGSNTILLRFLRCRALSIRFNYFGADITASILRVFIHFHQVLA